MLGDIDFLKKPYSPKLYTAKPDKEIIDFISTAYAIIQPMRVHDVNELSFQIPYFVEINHKLMPNRSVEILREQYLIKAELGPKIEWYIITDVHDVMDEDKSYRKVQAIGLQNELARISINGYAQEAKGAQFVINELLEKSNWSVDYIATDFELSKRTFEFNSDTILSALFSIAEMYNAVLVWDTDKRTMSLVKPELHGTNKGFHLSHGQYVLSLSKELDSKTIVTRLKVEGRDGLTIQEVNKTGMEYLEDFSYFIYPFRRDPSKNVIQSSYYMSDSLCHALLDYYELLDSIDDEYENYYVQRTEKIALITQLEAELRTLLNEEKIINSIMLNQQFNNPVLMFFEDFVYSSPQNFTYTTQAFSHYVVMAKSSSNNISVSVNGLTRSVQANQWVVLAKLTNSAQINIQIGGSANGANVSLQVANISIDEYNQSGNESVLVNKFSVNNKQMQIQAKRNQIAMEKTNLQTIMNQLGTFQQSISLSSNLTSAQMNELNQFVYMREFKDEQYVDAKDLLKASQEKFVELKAPQLSMSVDIENFLESITEQRNWNKLVLGLGDYGIVEYEQIGIEVEAKIIEMEYDYDNFKVTLTIANVRELYDDRKRQLDLVKESKNNSAIIDSNRNRWTEAIVDQSEMSRLFDNFWDKVTNTINMAINQQVIIDDKGITIIEPNDPNRFLRLTNGAIGLTRSGGLRYETAISADGVIAEMVLGKLILGSRVTIGDQHGIWLTEGPRTTITDRCGREAMKLGLYDTEPDKYGVIVNRYSADSPCSTNLVNRIIVDSDDGFVIEKREGNSFGKVAWLDTDGLLNVKKMQIDMTDGMLSNGIEIDSVNGIVITRSDNMVRGKFNAVDGFSFERNESGTWRKKMWIEPSGRFYAEDLYAKRLTIANDADEIILNSRTDYLNIGLFTRIIADGKLTAIEKLTLKQEWETIQTEYDKLLQQANQYKTSIRDNHQTVLIDIPPFVSAFTQLSNYVTPLLAEMHTTTEIDRDVFKQRFQSYYDQAQRIINEITNALKWSSVQLGVAYNKTVIDHINGIVVTRSDDVVKTTLNATEGISIKKNGVNKFYVDTDGVLHAEDLIAKRLIIHNNNNELILDARTDYLNLGKLSVIITDGKLTAIEKLTLKQEIETIQTEYLKLLSQANQYTTSARGTYAQLVSAIPPFSSAYSALMNYVTPLLANMAATTTVDRDVFKQTFQTYYDRAHNIINLIQDAMKWSSLQLGENYNNVVVDAQNGVVVTRGDGKVETRLNATEGISISKNGKKQFYVDTDGTLIVEDIIASKLIITAKPFGELTNDAILLDAKERILRLDNFSLIVGKLSADNISSDILTAADGFIANLTANKLKSIGRTAENSWTNYISIEDNKAMWITGKAIPGSGEQRKNALGEPYYWTDAARSGITTQVTSYPVMAYDYDEKIKAMFHFVGQGESATPQIVLGEGDGAVKWPDGSNKSSRGYVDKLTGSLDITYWASNNGRERSIELADEGISFVSQQALFNVVAQKFQLSVTEGGELTIENQSGSKLIFPTNGNATLEAANTLTVKAGGAINFSGSGYNFE